MFSVVVVVIAAVAVAVVNDWMNVRNKNPFVSGEIWLEKCRSFSRNSNRNPEQTHVQFVSMAQCLAWIYMYSLAAAAFRVTKLFRCRFGKFEMFKKLASRLNLFGSGWNESIKCTNELNAPTLFLELPPTSNLMFTCESCVSRQLQLQLQLHICRWESFEHLHYEPTICWIAAHNSNGHYNYSNLLPDDPNLRLQQQQQ